MKTIKGLFSDSSVYDHPPGYLLFAKNILLTEKVGAIGNEPGFLKLSNIPGQTFIGLQPILDDTVTFGVTTAGKSEIGLLNSTGGYTKIIDDDDLVPSGSKFNFSINAPIDSTFYTNVKGERVVAWIDDNNTPKIINIDNPSLQIQDYELFSSADLQIPIGRVSQTGGSVLTGVYRILYNYEDTDGSLSGYSAPSAPVSIIKDSSSATPDPLGQHTIAGNTGGIATSKGITITIGSSTPLDSNYSFVRIVIMKTINNITSVELISKLPVPASGLITTVYTGNEQATTLTFSEVITPTANYINAKAITQLNNRLYLADLTTAPEIALQKFCMNAVIKWKSTLIVNSRLTFTEFAESSGTEYSTFAHGEVYAFYLQFRNTKTGQWTKGFIVPGQAYDAALWAANGYTDNISPGTAGPYYSGTSSPSFPKYRLEDAGIVNTSLNTGTMGVWKNDNETYPSTDDYNGTVDYSGNPIPGGKDFRGQPVVHHKFPTVAWTQTVHAATTSYGKTTFDMLTVIAENVNLPAELSALYSSFRICYAKRDIGNATVISTSNLFFFGGGFTSGTLKPIAANVSVGNGTGAQNIMIQAQDVSPNYAIGSEFIRFHGFNTQVDLPAVSPTYLRQELKYTYLNGATTPDAAFPTDPRLITDVASNAAATRKWGAYIPYNINTITTVTTANRFRNVSFIQYLPTGAIVNSNGFTINNVGGESCMLLKNNVAGLATATATDRARKYLDCAETTASPFFNDNSSKHITYLTSLCALKFDVYLSFFNQELAATDTEYFKVVAIDNSVSWVAPKAIRGGDVWVGYNTVHLQGPLSDNNAVSSVAGESLGEGCKAIHTHIVEVPKNVNYRYSTVTDSQTAFYADAAVPFFPKILTAAYATSYLGLMNLFKSPVYLYNSDYNLKNDIGGNLTPYDPYIITETRFPTTIATSLAAGNETNVVFWKTFLANDRYTMPRNKGNIINLQGVENQRLYIHMENGLYITRDRIALKTTEADVTVGTGNIFDVTPTEVVSIDSGYGGTQHKFGCVLTKIGYAFADLSQGKIFLHSSEGLQEISKNGLRQFWRDVEYDVKDVDNPFIGLGITLAYDEKFNRLLVTIKNSYNPNKFITASYSPELQAWCSFHDYNPGYMFANRGNRLYSIVNDYSTNSVDLYLHNAGPYGFYYNTVAAYPLLADVVYNTNYKTEYFTSINWITAVTDPTDTLLKNETVDYITARSSDKSTGRLEVEQYINTISIYDSNTRLTEQFWAFNRFRNVAIPNFTESLTLGFYDNYAINDNMINPNLDWYDKGRFIDAYMIVRYEYSNASNNKFLLLDHNVETRKSYRG